jgi:hypothetical protein
MDLVKDIPISVYLKNYWISEVNVPTGAQLWDAHESTAANTVQYSK